MVTCTRMRMLSMTFFWCLLSIHIDSTHAQALSDAKDLREGFLVQVPLPITGDVDLQVRTMIEKTLENLPVVEAAEDRPVLVLQFDTSTGRSGRGSQFERCISLARFLTSRALNKVRTIAYIKGGSDSSPLSGHALLVALACERWYANEDGGIGSVGEEPEGDQLILDAYRSLAARRLVIPETVILGLLEPARGIFRVEAVDGSLSFVDRAELQRMEQAGQVAVAETLVEPGEEAVFSSDLLFRFQLIEQRISDRRDLASRLNLRPESLEGDPSLGASWNAIQIELKGPIDQTQVSWVLAALQQRLSEGVNLIIIAIDSGGGSFRDANRLAQQLGRLDPLQVRTVAVVTREVRGAAAFLALACQHLVMEESAVLGGNGQPPFAEDDRRNLVEVTPDLARALERDESIFLALTEPGFPLTQYRHEVTGETRYWSEEQYEQLAEPTLWQKVREVPVSEGLTATQADDVGIVRYLVKDRSEVEALYQLEESPELLVPTAAFRGIQRFAKFLASPWISWMLLFGAMMFFSTELSSPGLGVPGFAAAVCFMLFFWSQYLNGNADWLEIMLFALGGLSLALEIFVVPGFGIFGVGGILMMLVSVILASQTFIWPTTQEDYSQLPISLSMVFALFFGVATPMMLIPRYMNRIPILRRLSLNPAEDTEFAEVGSREAILQLDYLKGKVGIAVTSLVPGGKVRFGDEIYSVVTDGRPIDDGDHVVVREVRGTHVVVEPVDL